MDLFELSRILSRDDVIHLTQQLNVKLNNKKKISEITGLTRRALDNIFKEHVRNIKEDTKFRLLGASFTHNREYSLNFILNRLKILITSAAYSNLDFLYEKLLDTHNLEEFHELYSNFITILQENKYYLIQNYRDELFRLLHYLETEQQAFLKFYISPTEIIEAAKREDYRISNLIDKAKSNEFFIKRVSSPDFKTTVEQDESMDSFISIPTLIPITKRFVPPLYESTALQSI